MLEHVLEKSYVLDYLDWNDRVRGVAASSRRKRMQHICSITSYLLNTSPELKEAYSGVHDMYRRLMNQLHSLEVEEHRSEAELIRDGGKWVPFPVLIELCLWMASKVEGAVAAKEAPECIARLAHDWCLLSLLTFYGWRNSEVVSLEVVTQEELKALSKKARCKAISDCLEKCDRNFLVRPTEGTRTSKWTVLTCTYKTVKSYGRLSDDLISQVGEAFDVYVGKGYREILLGDQSHRFVFVRNSGRPMSKSGSDYIPDLFYQYVKIRLLCPVRRKAFISHGLRHGWDHDSMAQVLRHSPAVMSRSYDRRTNAMQTRATLTSALSLASILCEGKGEEEICSHEEQSLCVGNIVTWESYDQKFYGKVLELQDHVKMDIRS